MPGIFGFAHTPGRDVKERGVETRLWSPKNRRIECLRRDAVVPPQIAMGRDASAATAELAASKHVGLLSRLDASPRAQWPRA